MNRDLLFYKLLQYNIDGNMYKAVRALSSKPLSCIVRLNEVNTEWFESTSGVKQGDSLSPIFIVVINDLITEINGLPIVLRWHEYNATVYLIQEVVWRGLSIPFLTPDTLCLQPWRQLTVLHFSRPGISKICMHPAPPPPPPPLPRPTCSRTPA